MMLAPMADEEGFEDQQMQYPYHPAQSRIGETATSAASIGSSCHKELPVEPSSCCRPLAHWRSWSSFS
jgi:hypothetical protein